MIDIRAISEGERIFNDRKWLGYTWACDGTRDWFWFRLPWYGKWTEGWRDKDYSCRGWHWRYVIWRVIEPGEHCIFKADEGALQ